MIFKTKTTKFISVLLIISLLTPAVFFAAPRKTEAGWPVFDYVNAGLKFIGNLFNSATAASTTTETTISIQNVAKEVARQALMAVARAFLQEITKSIVTWINSGFHGNPLYIENPDSFFKDIAKYEIKTAIDLYGYDELLYPFGKDFALRTINAYKNAAANNARYSLSTVLNDPVVAYNYRTNFNYGGWNAFLINTQYPQNNYLGFQMQATEELANKLRGTVQTAAEKVNTTLAQGQGFLSPQTCPTNPNYNNGYNEFVKPSFDTSELDKKYKENYPYPNDDNNPTEEERARIAEYEADYKQGVADLKELWAKENVCPGGLVATTPGHVVANQITTAMSSQFRQSELAAAMGNSIAAIVNALVNKFIQDGLNSLAGSSGTPPADTWNYNGLTLGGPTPVGTNNTFNWDVPDQILELSEFKEKVAEGIEKTKLEILMMDNRVPTPENGPGISQVIAQIWPRVQTLDICQPGPDLNWQRRLDQESQRNASNFQPQDLNNPPSTQTLNQINLNTVELQFAVDFFRDWIEGQLLDALPSSVDYMNEINGLQRLSQQYSELKNRLSTRKNALSRLESIQAALDAQFPGDTQPETGSEAEGQLVSLWKQYDAISLDVSNDTTLEETISELNSTIYKKNQLDSMITKCSEERAAKGWQTPGGSTSLFGSTGASEQIIFCDSPIIGGYSHETFVNSGTPAFPQIPLVNASGILIGSQSVNVELSCSIIFRASVLDYKGDLPSF